MWADCDPDTCTVYHHHHLHSLERAIPSATSICWNVPQHNISVCNLPSGSVVYAPTVSSRPCTSAQEELFWPKFVKGNITRCNGCGKHDLPDVLTGKLKKPPGDLCLRHKEYVIFENPHTGKHRLVIKPEEHMRNYITFYFHSSISKLGCSEKFWK